MKQRSVHRRRRPRENLLPVLANADRRLQASDAANIPMQRVWDEGGGPSPATGALGRTSGSIPSLSHLLPPCPLLPSPTYFKPYWQGHAPNETQPYRNSIQCTIFNCHCDLYSFLLEIQQMNAIIVFFFSLIEYYLILNQWAMSRGKWRDAID